MTHKVEKFVSVVAPLQDAGSYLEEFVEKTSQLLTEVYREHELILVDDGSLDNTFQVCSDLLNRFPNLRLISLSRQFGYRAAISAGLDTAIGDYVLVLDAASDMPELIPKAIAACEEGWEIVYGVSQDKARRNFLSAFVGSILAKYIKRSLRIEVPHNLTIFRCLSRSSLNALTRINSHHRFYEFMGSIIGFRSCELRYTPRWSEGRNVKTSRRGVGLHDLASIIVENSAHPLRIVSAMGVGIGSINLIYMLWVIGIFLFKKEVAPGWTTLSFQTSGLFFCVIVMLTAMSEYIGRLLNALRDQPPYVIRQELNSAIMSVDRRMNVVDLNGESAVRLKYGSNK